MRKKKKPVWYTARVHFRSDIQSKKKYKTHLWKESFFLVWAISRKHAERRAKQLARRSKHTYTNFAGDVITWRFAALLDVHELAATDFREGTEVYASFFAHPNPPRLAKPKSK
jgi:hypothetical protein